MGGRGGCVGRAEENGEKEEKGKGKKRSVMPLKVLSDLTLQERRAPNPRKK